MSDANVVIELVEGKAGRAAFVDTGRDFAAREPHWVPQLRSEQLELVNPEKNPFFGHAAHQLFLARRGGKPVGRISAHIDRLAIELPREQGFGPGAGMFERGAPRHFLEDAECPASPRPACRGSLF